MRRVIYSLLAIALVSALGTGCGGRSRSSPKLAHFESKADGIAFDYPASWRLRLPDRGLVFVHYGSRTIVFLSKQPLHGQCRVQAPGKKGVLTTCKGPIRKLHPGSVLVTVSTPGTPDGTFANAKGRLETIAGRRAKVDIKRPGTCKSFDGDETFDASIQSGRGYYSIEACLRGPHLGEREREFRALLASIKLTRP